MLITSSIIITVKIEVVLLHNHQRNSCFHFGHHQLHFSVTMHPRRISRFQDSNENKHFNISYSLFSPCRTHGSKNPDSEVVRGKEEAVEYVKDLG